MGDKSVVKPATVGIPDRIALRRRDAAKVDQIAHRIEIARIGKRRKVVYFPIPGRRNHSVIGQQQQLGIFEQDLGIPGDRGRCCTIVFFKRDLKNPAPAKPPAVAAGLITVAAALGINIIRNALGLLGH